MSGRLSDLLRHGARDASSPYLRVQPSRNIEAIVTRHRKSFVGTVLPLRIGYLNPWIGKAENHAFQSLAIAAERVGHVLVQVTTSDEIASADLDFVIAVASTQPKLTSIPTFACIHEPRSRFVANEPFFQNLLSYDGYLTVSEGLHPFLRAIAAGFGGYGTIGRYYNTPQISEAHADVAGLAMSGDLRLCYFGTNWDPRSRPLFRALSTKAYIRFHGPAESWSYLSRGYHGALPFDGVSVQATYAAFGAGLVVLSKDHLLDDVISNRIFEISSVGAIAVCPDTPWIRKHFGDSVLYYPPHGTVREMVAAIDAAIDLIRADPMRAARQAEKARAVFERDFCAEKMLLEATEFFREWQAGPGRSKDAADEPLIDVIVRVGGRPLDTVRRAIASIDAQRSGRFRVVFVRHGPVDLSSLTAADWSRIEDFTIVELPKGTRAETMTAGLKSVTSPYFCLLDDDDFWLSHHVGTLLKTAERAKGEKVYCYSGYLSQSDTVVERVGVPAERRRIEQCSPASGTIWDILGRLQTGGFLASSDLLREVDLDDWTLQTAEDSLLHGSLIAAAQRVDFTWRATTCWSADSVDGSNFNARPSRSEDLAECFIRLGSKLDRIESAFAGRSIPPWERIAQTIHSVFEDKSERIASGLGLLVLEEGLPGTSVHDRDDLDLREIGIAERFAFNTEPDRDEQTGVIGILPPPSPWALGAIRSLEQAELFDGPQWVVLEFDRLYGSYGVGLKDHAGGWLTRMEAPASRLPMELWLYVSNPAEVAGFGLENWTGISTEAALLRRAWVARLAPDVKAADASLVDADCRDLTPDLQSKGWVHREGTGFHIPADAPAGHALYGPYLPIAPGSYTVILELMAIAAPDRICAGVEVGLASGTILATREILGREVAAGPIAVEFDVPAATALEQFETRLSHIEGVELRVISVQLRPGSSSFSAITPDET